jgi:hypothetical protein
MDIDYALMWNFVDLDGRPRQLRFRRDADPKADTDVLCGSGHSSPSSPIRNGPMPATPWRSAGPAWHTPTSNRPSTAGRAGR